MQSQLVCELVDFFSGYDLIVVKDIVNDGVIKEVGSLRHHTNLAAEILKPHVLDVLSVE